MGTIKEYFEHFGHWRDYKQYLAEMNNKADAAQLREYVDLNYKEPKPKPAPPKPKPAEPKKKPAEDNKSAAEGREPWDTGIKFSRSTYDPNHEPPKDDFYTLHPEFKPDYAKESFADYMSRVSKIKPSFSSKVTGYMNAKGLKAPDVYGYARMSRQTWSHIMMPGVKISKDSAIQVAIGLHLSLEQAEELLGLAGFTFVMSDKRDVALTYFFKNHIYSITEINSRLEDLGLKLLGA